MINGGHLGSVGGQGVVIEWPVDDLWVVSQDKVVVCEWPMNG